MIEQQVDILTPVSEPLADALALIGPQSLNDYFRAHSKTFSFASRFFPEEQRTAIARVYAFCRFTDDLVDDHPGGPEHALFLINQWEKVVRHLFAGSHSGVAWLDDLMRDSRRKGVELDWISDLIAGVRFDIGKVRLRTIEDLLRYSYQVASTVGLWVSAMLGVTDTAQRKHAVELGKAMQITNIIRDVGEDLRRDRIYIPQVILNRHGLAENDLVELLDGYTFLDNYARVLQDLMSMADKLYDSSWEGIKKLPGRMRLPIAVAAKCYHAIQDAVTSNNFNNFSKRAYTTRRKKLACTASAIVRLTVA